MIMLTDRSTVGITQHTQRAHIARATLEATCFQTKAILDAMEKDSDRKLAELAVDGGMSNSDLCMQVWSNGKLFNSRNTLISSFSADPSRHYRHPS